MTKNDIVVVPEPNLRKRSKKVGLITDEIRQIIADMKAATIDWENSREHEASVGLASVQVNIMLRIFIVRNDTENVENKAFTVFINPEIVKKIGPLEEDYEGCLSVPDIYGRVKRHKTVKVRAVGEDGKEFRVTAHDFLARILQHETDHTNGILFIDHIKDDPTAFFRMDTEGKIEPVVYETDIKNNSMLWSIDD